MSLIQCHSTAWRRHLLGLLVFLVSLGFVGVSFGQLGGLGIMSGVNAPGRVPFGVPYFEANFRGGSVQERGETDVFFPLYWERQNVVYADLRGAIGGTSFREGNWAVAARHLTQNGVVTRRDAQLHDAGWKCSRPISGDSCGTQQRSL